VSERTRVTFTLQGNEKDDGNVRARDFASFLDSVLACLRQLERLVGASRDKVVYRITDLQHGSAGITLEAVGDDEEVPSSVVALFLDSAESLVAGRVAPPQLDRPALEAFRGLAAPLRHHVTAIAVEGPDRRFDITRSIQDAVEGMLGDDVATFDSLSGYLDALNIHAEPVFYLYPPTVARGIRCFFAPSVLEKVTGALARYVTVTGEFLYHARETFPVRIDVQLFEVNPSTDNLPRLRSLIGSLPGLPEGLTSEAYVRARRDG